MADRNQLRARRLGRCCRVGRAGSPNNPVAVRQHQNVAYQGLRAIPGHWSGYPLIDSFFARGVGVGVRHRGAAAVLQVTSNADTRRRPQR